jgi:hypothetical protein
MEMTRDDIIRMAREAGLLGYESRAEEVHNFAALVAQHEREACAKVCEEYNKRQCYNDEDMAVANECAAAIRTRGNHA